jgi:nicotinamidase-related amidase
MGVATRMAGENGVPGLLDRERCMFVLIDVQPLFVDWNKGEDPSLLQRLQQYLLVSKIFEIPTLVTLEEPIETKGELIDELKILLSDNAVIMPKKRFNLCDDPAISEYLATVNKDQVVIAGCEIDVCVLQSCFGLLAKGKEVFLLVDGIFSSATFVQPAIERMIKAGAQPMTYKSFYYELHRSVGPSALPKSIESMLDQAEDDGVLLEPEDVPEPGCQPLDGQPEDD